MTDPTTTDSGRRYAFAPHPDPIEEILHRIHIVFEEPDGRLWSSGTDIMAPTMDSAEAFAGDLNSRLGFDYTIWTEFARRVFAAKQSGSERPEGGGLTPSE